MFRGMAEGWFTGRKLGQYFNETENDPLNARQIINANDDDDLIEGYHYQFLDALTAATIPEAEFMLGPVRVDIATPPGVPASIVLNGQLLTEGATS
jgi:putative chitinase